MDRRKFLLQSGLAVSAGAILNACETKAASSNVVDAALSYETWPDIRKHFLFTSDKIHMSQMLFAAHPKQVREAIKKHQENFDSNPVEYWENNYALYDTEVRKKAGEYMVADPSEIALTDSTTMGLAMLYSGFKLKSGDEILTTTHDHYVTEKALEFAAAKTEAVIKRVSLYSNPWEASTDEIVSIIKKNITPKTKIVAITFVHSCTGVKTPVKQIAAMIKEVNASRKDRIYLCVDGVHGFGIENVSMTDLGCDFFVAGTHKWIFGPRGTGVLFGKKDAWDMVAPIIPSFDNNPYNEWLGVYKGDLSFGELIAPGGFHSFEHRWALGEAFDFQLKIGKARVTERSHNLSARLKDGLSSIKHIKLITPRSEEISAGINCFLVDGMNNLDVVKKLLTKNIIASESPYKTSYVRLTPSIINSEEEVDICLRELEKIRETA